MTCTFSVPRAKVCFFVHNRFCAAFRDFSSHIRAFPHDSCIYTGISLYSGKKEENSYGTTARLGELVTNETGAPSLVTVIQFPPLTSSESDGDYVCKSEADACAPEVVSMLQSFRAGLLPDLAALLMTNDALYAVLHGNHLGMFAQWHRFIYDSRASTLQRLAAMAQINFSSLAGNP